MYIWDHAVRRYKQRVGKRTASKRRVRNQIKHDLKVDVVTRKPSKVKGHYIVVTSKYQAVCYKNQVVTIKHLEHDASNYDYFEKLKALSVYY